MEKSKVSFSEKIHFIGIGGIGMSGLAEVMKDMGFNVQGSDIANNKNIERCRKNGIKIFLKHNKRNIINSSIIVKSSAIGNNNPEIIFAKSKKLKILKRAEMLAHVVSLKKKYRNNRFTRKNHYNISYFKNFIRCQIRSNNNNRRCNKFYKTFS